MEVTDVTLDVVQAQDRPLVVVVVVVLVFVLLVGAATQLVLYHLGGAGTERVTMTTRGFLAQRGL